MRADGYLVVEASDDFEQTLTLDHGPQMPPDGILNWRGPRESAALFATRQQAQAAIARTEHWRLAWGDSPRADGTARWPEKRNCVVVPLRMVPAPVLQQQEGRKA